MLMTKTLAHASKQKAIDVTEYIEELLIVDVGLYRLSPTVEVKSAYINLA